MRPVGRGAATLTLVLAGATASCNLVDASGALSLDDLPRLEVEVDRRIGDVEDPDYGFSRVVGLDVDRDGNLFVGEAATNEIRVYSPEGQLLRRIGREGEGPGEFPSAPRFGLIGDTLWTVSGGFKIALFDRLGTLLSTGRTDGVTVILPGTVVGTILPRLMGPDGIFTGSFTRISSSRDREPSEVQPTDAIPWPRVRFDASGAVADTAGWVNRPPPQMWRPPSEDDYRSETVELAGRRMFVPRPPSQLPRWVDVVDGHFVVDTPTPVDGATAHLTLTRFDLAGDTVFSREIEYTPDGYSDVELDSIAFRAVRGEPGGFVPYSPTNPPPVPDNLPQVAADLRARMSFPAFRQPIEYSWPANDGSLWMRRSGSVEGMTRWVLVDPDGRPYGEVELPEDVTVLWASGDSFWTVVPDELEVPWVTRYRIRGG